MQWFGLGWDLGQQLFVRYVNSVLKTSWVCGFCQADTLVQDGAAGLDGEMVGPPTCEALVREGAPGLDGDEVGPPIGDAIEVESSPEKIKPDWVFTVITFISLVRVALLYLFGV